MRLLKNKTEYDFSQSDCQKRQSVLYLKGKKHEKHDINPTNFLNCEMSKKPVYNFKKLQIYE